MRPKAPREGDIITHRPGSTRCQHGKVLWWALGDSENPGWVYIKPGCCGGRRRVLGAGGFLEKRGKAFTEIQKISN